MNPGSAALCVSDVIRVPMRQYFGNLDETDEARDAARYADSLAESVAEDRRDYESAYQAGRKAAETDAEALEARAELVPLLGELRTLRRSPWPVLSRPLARRSAPASTRCWKPFPKSGRSGTRHGRIARPAMNPHGPPDLRTKPDLSGPSGLASARRAIGAGRRTRIRATGRRWRDLRSPAHIGARL